jgi:hypothetical protein
MRTKKNQPVPQQVFRQFAWNLAGTLALSRSAGKAAGKPDTKR